MFVCTEYRGTDHKRALDIRNFRARANFPPPTIATGQTDHNNDLSLPSIQVGHHHSEEDETSFLKTQS